MANTVIGLDCGASHSSMVIWTGGKKVVERHDLPGANKDLINNSQAGQYFFMEFEKLSDYKNADIVIGMAGLDDSREVAEADRWLRGILEKALPYSSLTVMSDIELLMWAGSGDGTGIGLIAGTGSNCLGRDAAGRVKKVGGMSHLLSDEGGGFMVGWKTLHLITKMWDGRVDRTNLLDEVLAFYGKNNIVDLKRFLTTTSDMKAEIAKCAPLALSASNRGEDEAGRIVAEESSELVRMVVTVNNDLGGDLPVYLAGSLFRDSFYRDQFIVSLHRYYPTQKISVVSPIDGTYSYATKEFSGRK